MILYYYLLHALIFCEIACSLFHRSLHQLHREVQAIDTTEEQFSRQIEETQMMVRSDTSNVTSQTQNIVALQTQTQIMYLYIHVHVYRHKFNVAVSQANTFNVAVSQATCTLHVQCTCRLYERNIMCAVHVHVYCN